MASSAIRGFKNGRNRLKKAIIGIKEALHKLDFGSELAFCSFDTVRLENVGKA